MEKEGRVKKYSRYFDEQKLFKKLKSVSGKLGVRLLYSILILFYLTTDKSVPLKTRAIFIAALGYLILPTDAISDFIPGLGFTDDAALIAYAISSAANYITPQLKEKALKKLEAIVGKEKAGEISLENFL